MKLFLGPWNKEKHHNFGIFQTIFIYKHSGIYQIREALTGPAAPPMQPRNEEIDREGGGESRKFKKISPHYF